MVLNRRRAAARVPVLVRRTHKWLALFVGAQVVIWTLSGLYMTAVHIDIIHGDHLVRPADSPALAPGGLADPLMAAARVPDARGVRLHWLGERPTYVVESAAAPVMLDARTGAPVPAPTQADIRRLARQRFAGDAPIARVTLLEEVPAEIRGHAAPVWRVDFEGWNKPTLYFSPATGELLSRRHELWRVFDFVWMLHIMDYEERENVNNPLLRTFTWGALAMAVSGAFLLLYSFPRRRRGRAKA